MVEVARAPRGLALPSPQGKTTSVSDAEMLAMGRALYASNCAPCHQPNGEGNLAIFPALNRNAFVMVADPAGVIDTVLYGREVMPDFAPALSYQEIAAVVSYIRNGWDNQAAVVSEAQVRNRAETTSRR